MKTVYAAAALAALCFASAGADAATLQDVAAAMGSARVQSVQLTASGMSTIVGQQFEPSGAFPDTKVPRYARSEDYANGAIALDYALVQDGTMRSAGGLAFGVENPRKGRERSTGLRSVGGRWRLRLAPGLGARRDALHDHRSF